MNTEKFYQEIGNSIRYIRKEHKLTQEQLGKLLGLTKSAIVNYETGIRKIPVDVLVKFTNLYGISIDRMIKKQKTLADVIQSETGNITLTEQQEQLLINYIQVLLGSEK